MATKKAGALLWISHQGLKHRLDPTTSATSCGLHFTEPFPDCNRADPICKGCMRAMRGA
jgi:hypothetical protein